MEHHVCTTLSSRRLSGISEKNNRCVHKFSSFATWGGLAAHNTGCVFFKIILRVYTLVLNLYATNQAINIPYLYNLVNSISAAFSGVTLSSK